MATMRRPGRRNLSGLPNVHSGVDARKFRATTYLQPFTRCRFPSTRSERSRVPTPCSEQPERTTLPSWAPTSRVRDGS